MGWLMGVRYRGNAMTGVARSGSPALPKRTLIECNQAEFLNAWSYRCGHYQDLVLLAVSCGERNVLD
jgi:hypothetical protein